MSHRMLLRLGWAFVSTLGAYAAKTKLAELLPMLFAAEDRGRTYHAEQTAGWVKRIAAAIDRSGERKDFERFIAKAPELLDPTNVARGG